MLRRWGAHTNRRNPLQFDRTMHKYFDISLLQLRAKPRMTRFVGKLYNFRSFLDGAEKVYQADVQQLVQSRHNVAQCMLRKKAYNPYYRQACVACRFATRRQHLSLADLPDC